MNAIATRLAAPAPHSDEDESPALGDAQRDLDALCERWVHWCATRRLFGPSPKMGSILGKLTGTRLRPMHSYGPNAFCSADVAAFHLAYVCQPDALDKRVFDLYYVHRVTPIKSAAAALDISRKHFYTVLADFRQRVYTAAQAIREDQERHRQSLPHARAPVTSP